MPDHTVRSRASYIHIPEDMSSVRSVTTSNPYSGAMAHQTVNMLWVLLAFSSICFISFLPRAGANSTYSTNPADYDFGWLAAGTWNPGSLPPCTYCLNALVYDANYSPTPADEQNGPYWNHTVKAYRCDGVEPNEFWAYDEPTRTIVFGNLTEVLCIDAVDLNALGGDILKLRYCDSSTVSQQWTKNGSRLISALPGPKGEQLFIALPLSDQDTSASIQLTVLPSVPSSNYSANFTFLSRNNFVDTSTDRFTTQGLLAITNYSVDTIVNGGFERSTIQSGQYVGASDAAMAQPSYLPFCGWVVDYGPIDHSGPSLPPPKGNQSVHLNTYNGADFFGQVRQTIQTEVNIVYVLSFYFNGLPPSLNLQLGRPSCSTTEAQLEVRISNSTSTGNNSRAVLSDGYGLQQNFSIDVTNASINNFYNLWQQHSIMFRALANVTNFSFASLNFDTSCGPMIDEVTLVRFKPKSFWQKTVFREIVGSVAGLILLVGILVGVYFGRRRFCGPEVDYWGLYRRICGPEEDYWKLYKNENARVFSVKELSAATKKFSAVLGEGGFGTVYKADFPDGTVGAVKVEKLKEHFNRSSKVLAIEEIAVLLRVHHRNLVNLIGFCIHRGRHMLVFEYLPNELYDRLHKSVTPVPPGDILDSIELRQLYEKVLPWHVRTKIASDVAYGLEYLHHDANPPIVHRDVKSQNILLTATDSAKLADFGLSKAAPPDATAFQSIETMVRGSIGYLDPQYFLTGVFSAKSDVYSYGVVLLELISGHHAIYNAGPLSAWAASYFTSPSLYHELVDEKLKGKYEPDELESLVELSKMCMQGDSRMRPNMRQVVAFLNAKGLVVAGGESKHETIESEIISRETYDEMHRMLMDSSEAAVSSETRSNDSNLESPGPRDLTL